MNNIEREILTLIGENIEAPDVFTATSEGLALIRQSANDAIHQMCVASGGYRRKYFLPLREGARFYRIVWGSQDYFGYPVGVWDRNRHYALVQTHPLLLASSDRGWLRRSGDPLSYFQVGFDVLGVHYKPSSSGTVLELDCVAIPKEYTTDQTPIKIRQNFQRGIVYFGAGEFYASRGDANRAKEYLDRYLEVAGLMKLKPAMPERQWQLGKQAAKEA